MARIISIRQALGITRQVSFCQLGGFDFHTIELTDQDNLIGQLSQAVIQLYLRTQESLVDKLATTFTASEFGRTRQPNGGVLGGKFYDSIRRWRSEGRMTRPRAAH